MMINKEVILYDFMIIYNLDIKYIQYQEKELLE